MTEKAVIDRFEGKFAVLFVGEENRKVDIPRSQLPAGVEEGMWLRVELDGGRLVRAEIDPEETARMRERIAARLARLRRGEHLKRR